MIEEEQIKLRGISGEQLYKHIMSMGWWRRNRLVSDTDTPVEVLIILAEDEDAYVQLSVLDNPHTPQIVKLWLEQDGYAGLSLTEFLAGINCDRRRTETTP